MKRAISCLLFLFGCSFSITALAVPVDNLADSNVGLDVEMTDNGDGTFGWWISIILNAPDDYAFIDTSIMTHPYRINQIRLTELDAIEANGGSANVSLASQQGLAAALDLNYQMNQDRDTVFDDGVWPGVLAIDLDSDLNNQNDGRHAMRVAAVSFTGGLGGALPGDQLIPIWHVTTTRESLWLTGIVQTLDQPFGRFEWHIPEPSALLLAGLGAIALVASTRGRRRP